MKVIDLDESQSQGETELATQMVVREREESVVGSLHGDDDGNKPEETAGDGDGSQLDMFKDQEWLDMQRAMIRVCEEHNAAAYRDWEEWEVRHATSSSCSSSLVEVREFDMPVECWARRKV